ncbi:hypothetical protein BCO18175_03063 [Burkholderia contaminans]|nr:hypothetical protein BCO18175_03063 [Burkholderia contaminans]
MRSGWAGSRLSSSMFCGLSRKRDCLPTLASDALSYRATAQSNRCLFQEIENALGPHSGWSHWRESDGEYCLEGRLWTSFSDIFFVFHRFASNPYFSTYPASPRTDYAVHRDLGRCPRIVFTGELTGSHLNVQLSEDLSGNRLEWRCWCQCVRKFVDTSLAVNTLADTYQPSVTDHFREHSAYMRGTAEWCDLRAQDDDTLPSFDRTSDSVFKLHVLPLRGVRRQDVAYILRQSKYMRSCPLGPCETYACRNTGVS